MSTKRHLDYSDKQNAGARLLGSGGSYGSHGNYGAGSACCRASLLGRCFRRSRSLDPG